MAVPIILELQWQKLPLKFSLLVVTPVVWCVRLEKRCRSLVRLTVLTLHRRTCTRNRTVLSLPRWQTDLCIGTRLVHRGHPPVKLLTCLTSRAWLLVSTDRSRWWHLTIPLLLHRVQQVVTRWLSPVVLSVHIPLRCPCKVVLLPLSRVRNLLWCLC